MNIWSQLLFCHKGEEIEDESDSKDYLFLIGGDSTAYVPHRVPTCRNT
jgi:hypothetical protein